MAQFFLTHSVNEFITHNMVKQSLNQRQAMFILLTSHTELTTIFSNLLYTVLCYEEALWIITNEQQDSQFLTDKHY